MDVLFSGKEEYFTPSQTAPTNKENENEASASVFSTPANVSQHNLLFNSVRDTTTSFFMVVNDSYLNFVKNHEIGNMKISIK